MQGRPLANDFTPGARIFAFVGGYARELVGRGIANTIAAGLYGVHLHAGELSENVGHFLQQRPVQLDVLAGADMRVALVIVACDVCQLAHLRAA